MDTTTMDAPVAKIEVAQAEKDERRHPRTASIQPSTDPLPSVDIPLYKTGRVHQESMHMAQANMIGKSMKRPRTGEVENASKKKYVLFLSPLYGANFMTGNANQAPELPAHHPSRYCSDGFILLSPYHTACNAPLRPSLTH